MDPEWTSTAEQTIKDASEVPQVIEIPYRGRLRIYGHGERLPGEARAHAGRVVVEWAGRTGHPASYGLLGGNLIDGLVETDIELDHDGSEFAASLAGSADRVIFGLPVEYRNAVTAGAADLKVPMRICSAAHAKIGSSAIVFERLMDMLSPLVQLTEAERTDDLIQKCWERAWNARDWFHHIDLPESYIDLRDVDRSSTRERSRLEKEIRREVGPGHRLFGRVFSVLASDTARDDVLISIEPNRVALVHLTYAQLSPERIPWPTTTIVLDRHQLEEQWFLRG